MDNHTTHTRPRISPRLSLGMRALLAGGLAALAGTAHAVEGGSPITPFGVFDFGAGIMPPPSPVAAVGLRATFYEADRLRDKDGRRAPVDARVRANSLGVALVKMTDIEVLGAKYGVSAVLPALDMRLSLGIPTPAGRLQLQDSSSGLGDIQVAPVILQWASPGLFQLAALQIQAPTGRYDRKNLINPGTNQWTFSPTYAFTYITPGGFEVSSNIQLNIQTRNEATDYRSGTQYQHEFALGQHFGPYTVGIGGYYYQQITDDRAKGLDDGNRARVMALGPAFNFFSPGSRLPNFWAHFYKEFNGKNRAEGTQVTLRAAWVF